MNYTLLDEFAKTALAGLMTNTEGQCRTDFLDEIAATAYRMAEAMVREKQRRDEAQLMQAPPTPHAPAPAHGPEPLAAVPGPTEVP